MQLTRRFFWAKQTDTKDRKITGRNYSNQIKKATSRNLSPNYFYQNLLKSITDPKLGDKLLKGKNLEVPKEVEQIQQNAYDRKHKKNTIPELNQTEKKHKEEPLHKIKNTGNMEQDRKKDQNMEISDTAMHQFGAPTTNA